MFGGELDKTPSSPIETFIHMNIFNSLSMREKC